MLYAYIGSDTSKALRAAHAFIDAEEKRAGVPAGAMERYRFTAAMWSDADFESVASGAGGLFGDPIVIVLDAVDEAKGVDIDRVIESAKKGQHLCIYIGNPDEEIEKKIKIAAKKTERFDLAPLREDKSNFELADMIGRRDKKAAWLKYRSLIDEARAADEIHGTIFWLFKNMKIASEETSVASGLHSFVYGKAQANAKKFSAEEIDKRLEILIKMHVRARSGEEDMESGMERFILSL